MKKIAIAAAFLALPLASVAAPASAQSFSYEGDWGVDCLKKGLQCWWSFEKTAKKTQDGDPIYKATYVAADAMDAKKVHCTMKTTASYGMVNGGMGLYLQVGPKKTGIEMREGDGSLFAYAPSDLPPECKGASIVNDLYPIGD